VSPFRDAVGTYGAAFVYVVLLYIGSNVLLRDPPSPLRHVPFLVGVGLVVHAVFAEDLDPVAYAIAGLAATLVGFVALATLAAALDTALPAVVTDEVTVAAATTLALLVTYARFDDVPRPVRRRSGPRRGERVTGRPCDRNLYQTRQGRP
jgi:hypothetical protein